MALIQMESLEEAVAALIVSITKLLYLNTRRNRVRKTNRRQSVVSSHRNYLFRWICEFDFEYSTVCATAKVARSTDRSVHRTITIRYQSVFKNIKIPYPPGTKSLPFFIYPSYLPLTIPTRNYVNPVTGFYYVTRRRSRDKLNVKYFDRILNGVKIAIGKNK